MKVSRFSEMASYFDPKMLFNPPPQDLNPSFFTLYTSPPPFTLNSLLTTGKSESEFDTEEALHV